MDTRYKFISVVALSVVGAAVGFWHESAVQSPVTEQADCNPHDPLSSCALEPQNGYPSGELVVVEGPELSSAGVTDGSLAVIRFAPKADAVDIGKFLDVNKASVIEGPKNGGIYTIRLPVTGKEKNDLIKQMQAQSAIVEFIATVQ
jgi:hypothetical protein